MPMNPLQLTNSIDETGSETTLVEAIMRLVQNRIAARELVPGMKLPSIRRMAESQNVSKSTIVEAYDRLATEGIIRSKPGSGFRVVGHIAPLSLIDIAPKLDREIDPLWVSRQSLEASPEILAPGCGWLPSSWMPEEILRKAMRSTARTKHAALSHYSTPLGLAPLRQLLSRRLTDYSLDVAAEQILLTDSGTQAIDLLCRYLLGPGDTVLVDDPCYFNFHALLRAHRATMIGIPYTPNGPDIDMFNKALVTHRPRLYITNSAVHNPTGARLSPIVAHRILKLADEHDLTIIEDDIFSDFESEPAPRLAAFGGLDRVVHVGSFSKSLSASVRCGYIASRTRWIEDLTDIKIAASFGGSHISEELVLAVLRDSGYRKHLDLLRHRLSVAMRQTSDKLAALGFTPWVQPRDGMFLWCHLPAGLDAAELARTALSSGIIFAPGNVFSSSQSASGFMRFNVSQSSDSKIFRFLEVTQKKMC